MALPVPLTTSFNKLYVFVLLGVVTVQTTILLLKRTCSESLCRIAQTSASNDATHTLSPMPLNAASTCMLWLMSTAVCVTASCSLALRLLGSLDIKNLHSVTLSEC